MNRPMILFAGATLLPLPLIAAAALWGGIWVLLAPAYMTVMAASLDRLVHRVTPPLSGAEFPAADALSATLAAGHFGLLALVVHMLAADHLNAAEKCGTFLAAGLYFGQVSNSNAHELIHRGGRGLRRLGMWVYISMLFGHHASAHVLVHHVHVATRNDPNSARLGEGFYRFAMRAWFGSFRQGWLAETARLRQSGRAWRRHPYLIYCGGAFLMIGLAGVLGGVAGLAALVALAGFSQMQLLLSDYVQHYGLSRAVNATGKAVPLRDEHSWNSPHWFSSALMLNAPRHSDHHLHPGRPYPALGLPDAGPILPRSLPVMACIALYPRGWRRVMNRRVPARPKPAG
jgi:alkane 1-monooxygenase